MCRFLNFPIPRFFKKNRFSVIDPFFYSIFGIAITRVRALLSTVFIYSLADPLMSIVTTLQKT